MQQELIAGDTLNFLTVVPDYLASDGWVLKFRLVPRTVGGTAIPITATAEGADHRVTVPAATTAGWGADSYGWTSWAEKAAEVYSVQSGQITMRPNPRTAAAGTDLRSTARKALDDAKAALATFVASNGMTSSYRIGDRERAFRSTAEIVKLITYLEQQVQSEELLSGSRQALGRRIHSRI